MEEVLEAYAQSYAAQQAVVCMNRQPAQLVREQDLGRPAAAVCPRGSVRLVPSVSANHKLRISRASSRSWLYRRHKIYVTPAEIAGVEMVTQR